MIAVILADRAPEARAEPMFPSAMRVGARHGSPEYQLPKQRLAIPSDADGDIPGAAN
jgi:hypothetical protein